MEKRFSKVEGLVVSLAAIVVAVLGVLGVVDAKVVAAATLAVLAVTAWELVRFQRTDADVLTILRSSSTNRPFLRNEYPDFSADLADASSVCVIAGVSFKTTIGLYYAAFQEALDRGLNIRLICPDPTVQPLLEAILAASPGRKELNHVRYDIITGIESARNLKEKSSTVGQIQIRLLPYVPAFGLVIITPRKGVPRAIVKLMAFQITNGQYPTFEVFRSDDNSWFSFFERQFDVHWAAATDVAAALPRGLP